MGAVRISVFKLPGLREILGLGEREIISFYGAGGKTSFLLRLAEELSQDNKKVILTTTTKIFSQQKYPQIITCDGDLAREELQRLLVRENVVVLGSSLLPSGKIDGPKPSLISRLHAEGIAPYILIEADGANRRPIKGYAWHEPVIPSFSTIIVPLLGSDALGLPISEEHVHRPELLAHQIGAAEGKTIGLEEFIRSLAFMLARGQKQAPTARAIPVINKTDLLEGGDLASNIAKAFLASPPGDVYRLLFTALAEDFPVHYIWEKPFARPFISCAVLAAGFSKRMGKDKLALDLKGKTILEHTVESARQSGADEIFIVTRPEQEWIGRLFSTSGIRVVNNPYSALGMSTSVQAAISASHPLTQGIIFALGDQPLVDPGAYQALIKSYSEGLDLVTYPHYLGKKGNPQLFDRRTWPLLMKLRGDQGGRGIISQIPDKWICGVEIPYSGVTEDIDTVEEYKRLLGQ
jgi:probable selenium-dependent hydroxylase accessory protein YqeC